MDEQYMRRAILLAQKGAGFTNPNPMVGAVIVKGGRIIGEGYHECCGQLHAERNAFAHLTEEAAGADLYVTLEPCCHYGRTPPCTEAIIENRIARVYIGSRDPNPLVAGKGAAILRAHGIEVVEDCIREECDAINPVFFHYITHRKPYVVMKYAMTLDGRIATYTGKSQWITGSEARKHVHMLRGRYASVLCGIGTVLADDPMLNARIEGAHQPLRIVVDSHGRIPLESRIVQTAGTIKTLIACSRETEKSRMLRDAGCEVLVLPGEDGRVSLRDLLDELGVRQVDSVLVEGGGEIHESFRKENLVQHVCCYIAPKLFGGRNAKGPLGGVGVAELQEAMYLTGRKVTELGEDLLLEYDCEVRD